jgi:hypothetical protein
MQRPRADRSFRTAPARASQVRQDDGDRARHRMVRSETEELAAGESPENSLFPALSR